MLFNTSQQIPNNLERYDVCIVGSGPAGIIWPVRFPAAVSSLPAGVRRAESCGRRAKPQCGAVDSTTVSGAHRAGGTPRQFGGTANLWSHRLRGESARHIRYVPLDEIDFERRDWVPESGWPFSRGEIEPYYERARTSLWHRQIRLPG